MSEPVTRWQPLFDFNEAERQISEIETAHTNEIAARADRFRLIGGGAGRVLADRNHAISVETPQQAAAAPEPLFGGDFAEIEAALLRTALLSITPTAASESRPPEYPVLRASREEAEPHLAGGYAVLALDPPETQDHHAPSLTAVLHSFPDAGAQSGDFMLFDDAAVSGSAAMADEDKRSRRPLYLMAALVFAGVAGIAATTFKRESVIEISQDALRSPAFAPAGEESGAAPAAASASLASPAQQASTAEDALPVADAASNTPASPAPVDAAPRVISLNEPAAPPAPAAAPAPLPGANVTASAPSSILAPPPVAATPALASIGEAKIVKTAAVRPDGSLIKAEPAVKNAAPKVAVNKALPAKTAAAKAAPKVAHLDQPHAAATAAGAAKTANAAKKPAVHATAVSGRPAAASPDAQVARAPAADPQPVAPKPSGPLAFVDTAVSSITGATGKLLDWGRTASGAH